MTQTIRYLSRRLVAAAQKHGSASFTIGRWISPLFGLRGTTHTGNGVGEDSVGQNHPALHHLEMICEDETGDKTPVKLPRLGAASFPLSGAHKDQPGRGPRCSAQNWQPQLLAASQGVMTAQDTPGRAL